MSHVLTLVASHATTVAGSALVDLLSRKLHDCCEPAGVRWLDEPWALDLRLTGLDEAGRADAASAIEDVLAGEPVDWALTPQASRRKSLLVADMESTIIENELLPELADLAGHRETVATLTARAMGGKIDFDGSLLERVALLAGLPAATIPQVAEGIRYTPGARTLLTTMRAAGARTALVSSGFRCFAEIVAEELGFDEKRANELEVSGSRLNGDVKRPILNGESKRAILEALCRRWDIEPSAAVAVGDGANDLAMLGVAGLGVAFHGSPAVAAQAPVRVDHGDLTTLLYFQGYGRDEFVL